MVKSRDKLQVTIIGAGISGLTAAIHLERLGYHPTIIEADTKVGGRVQTDIIEGYQLDRGFQVLLEAYPMAQKYLDYAALDLQQLDDGSLLYHQGTASSFGDPRRDRKFLLPILSSSHASLKDKWNVFALNQKLNGIEIEDLFSGPSQPTIVYLREKGFSEKIIGSFFRPFFSGIFLEPDLQTSSRMFEFVFKMFAQGHAVIPKKGMRAIPEQLKDQLQHTSFHFNTKVNQIVGTDIFLESGEKHASDFTIVATNPEGIIPNYASSLNWQACDNLYFTAKIRTIKDPIIGLNTADKALVNNIFYPTSLDCEVKGPDELLSVTVVKTHEYTDEELVQQVQHELASDFGINDVALLHHYKIPHALPIVEDLQHEREAGEQLLTEHIALAGDYLLNGSLNAAMTSGEKAAEIAHQTLLTQQVIP